MGLRHLSRIFMLMGVLWVMRVFSENPLVVAAKFVQFGAFVRIRV